MTIYLYILVVPLCQGVIRSFMDHKGKCLANSVWWTKYKISLERSLVIGSTKVHFIIIAIMGKWSGHGLMRGTYVQQMWNITCMHTTCKKYHTRWKDIWDDFFMHARCFFPSIISIAPQALQHTDGINGVHLSRECTHSQVTIVPLGSALSCSIAALVG